MSYNTFAMRITVNKGFQKSVSHAPLRGGHYRFQPSSFSVLLSSPFVVLATKYAERGNGQRIKQAAVLCKLQKLVVARDAINLHTQPVQERGLGVWIPIGVISGLYWGYIGIMESKTETTI